jgi:hypothetical protein
MEREKSEFPSYSFSPQSGERAGMVTELVECVRGEGGI